MMKKRGEKTGGAVLRDRFSLRSAEGKPWERDQDRITIGDETAKSAAEAEGIGD